MSQRGPMSYLHDALDRRDPDKIHHCVRQALALLKVQRKQARKRGIVRRCSRVGSPGRLGELG